MKTDFKIAKDGEVFKILILRVGARIVWKPKGTIYQFTPVKKAGVPYPVLIRSYFDVLLFCPWAAVPALEGLSCE